MSKGQGAAGILFQMGFPPVSLDGRDLLGCWTAENQPAIWEPSSTWETEVHQLSIIWKKQVLKYKSLFSLCTLLYSDGSRPKYCGQTSRFTRKDKWAAK